MAEKISAPTDTSPRPPALPGGARPGPPGRQWRRWLFSAGSLLFAALATMAVLHWRQPQLGERVRAGLPPQPDLSGRPNVLAAALAQAQTRATAPGDVLAGVAELGRLYHANGDNREAETCWRLLHDEQPREARWCYYLADLRRMASDYDEMAVLLAQTVKLAPDYAPAWLQLAGLQFKTGQLDRAAHNYQQRLALLPGDPYARLWLARIALQRGQQAEARRLIEQLLKDTPEFSSGHNLYAEMLAAEGDATGADRQRWLGRETGRFREADDPWLNALVAHCYDFERLCVLGTIEYQTAHGDRGRSLYQRAIAIRPADPTGYEFLGGLYLKLNDPAKARETLEQCLPRLGATKPSITFYRCLSQAYRDLKQPADAARIARQGLALLGENFELYSVLGTALGDLGQPEAAIAAFQQAIALSPNDAESNFNLALVLLGLDRLKEAEPALLRSLTLEPTFPKALILLGRLALESGQWEAAGKYLQPLYTSHPEMPESRQLMATWHLRAGAAAEAKNDPAAAERHYRDGLAVNRNHPELQASLGVMFIVQGRFADALDPLENYHRLQPANAQSCLFLGQAYAATGREAEARQILTEGIQTAERTGNAVTAKHCREILSQL